MQAPHSAGESELISEPIPPRTPPLIGLAARLERLRGLRKMLIFDIAGPLIAYNVLHSHGTSQVLALILAGTLPAIGVLIDFTRNRALDVVGCVVLGGLLLGALLGLVTHSPRAVLLEGSIVTAAFALSALGSLPTTRRSPTVTATRSARLSQPWRSASRPRPSQGSRAIISCRPVLAGRHGSS
jgi:hypothetical protein